MNVKKLFQIRPTNEEQNDFIITIGQHLATEKHFPTREEAEAYRDTPQWDMILAMNAEMFTIHEEFNHRADISKDIDTKVNDARIDNTKNNQ